MKMVYVFMLVNVDCYFLAYFMQLKNDSIYSTELSASLPVIRISSILLQEGAGTTYHLSAVNWSSFLVLINSGST